MDANFDDVNSSRVVPECRTHQGIGIGSALGRPEPAHFVNQLPKALKLLINGEKSRLESLERSENEALKAFLPETKKKLILSETKNLLNFGLLSWKYGIIPETRLTTGDNAAHAPRGNQCCATTFGMAHTDGLETLGSQLVDPGGTVPFPFPVPRPVPITKNDRTDNPTPQVLEESKKTSVQSGGLEGKILRRSLIPKARMQQKTTVP